MYVKLKPWVILLMSWIAIAVITRSYYSHTLNRRHTSLGHVTRLKDRWILVVDPVGGDTTVIVENHNVHVKSRYKKDGDWIMDSEFYVIPSGFNQITNKNLYGKILVVAKKCKKGRCSVPDEGTVWDVLVEKIPNFVSNTSWSFFKLFRMPRGWYKEP